MLVPRFFAPDLERDGTRITLSAIESQHLVRVRRLGAGDRVRVFDGRGSEREALVEVASARAAVLRLGPPVPPLPEAAVRVTLVQALLKNDGMDAVVRDATMLGVHRIVPVRTSRTVVSPRLIASGKAHARWRRVAVASAKQCGRAFVPVVEPLQEVEAVLGAAVGLRLLLAEPAAGAAPVRLPDRPEGDAMLAVGPEGGWAPDEIASAHASGWTAWSIVPWILRAESAAAAALSVLQHAWLVSGAGR